MAAKKKRDRKAEKAAADRRLDTAVAKARKARLAREAAGGPGPPSNVGQPGGWRKISGGSMGPDVEYELSMKSTRVRGRWGVINVNRNNQGRWHASFRAGRSRVDGDSSMAMMDKPNAREAKARALEIARGQGYVTREKFEADAKARKATKERDRRRKVLESLK